MRHDIRSIACVRALRCLCFMKSQGDPSVGVVCPRDSEYEKRALFSSCLATQKSPNRKKTGRNRSPGSLAQAISGCMYMRKVSPRAQRAARASRAPGATRPGPAARRALHARRNFAHIHTPKYGLISCPRSTRCAKVISGR